MEYEIPDEGEDVLFDKSTNPSLKPDEEELARPPAARRKEQRAPQKAELIPEEEDQLA